jgi:hypothetical protein
MSTQATTPTQPVPTSQQLRAYFWTSAIPFLGFGFMDNTIMIWAGNYIDCTIGVKFGLSTLSAAAIGQIVSAGGSIMFGDTIEQIARATGLPSSGLSSAQRRLPVARRVGFLGSFIGVVTGATLGLVNLYFMDTQRSTILKLEALREEQEFEFVIDVSNKKRRDATTVTVKGPDVDGLLASLTAAISAQGLSLVELHANPRTPESSDVVEDVFILRPRGPFAAHAHQIDDHDLEELGRALLAACKDPLGSHSLRAQIQVLQDENQALMDRTKTLERVIEDRQIKVEPANEETAMMEDRHIQAGGAKEEATAQKLELAH